MSSPAAHEPQRPAYRRRRRYVDSSVQRSLLLALMTLEVGLGAASIWLLHWRLVHFIEDSMYRMQVNHAGLTLMRLVVEGFPVLVLFVVANLLALTLVAGLWSARENLVLQDFVKLMEKTRELDFSADPEPRRQHQVLKLAWAWRARERTRFAALREQLANLQDAQPSDQSLQDLRVALTRLDQLLS